MPTEAAARPQTPTLLDLLSGDPRSASSGSDRPFALDGERVWLVREGRVDVFSVPVAADGRTGARHHLLRVGAGELLFGPGAAGGGEMRLLGVGSAGTVILPLEWEEVRAAARTPEGLAVLVEALDRWVERLCEAVRVEAAPQGCIDLPDGESTPPADAPAVRAGRGVSWLVHETGRSSVAGEDDLRVNGGGPVPLSRRLWLRPERGARLRSLHTLEMLQAGQERDGLQRLHALVMRCVQRQMLQEAEEARRRQSQRALSHARVLREACVRLAVSVVPSRAGQRPRLRRRTAEESTPDDSDALFAACRLVATQQGIQIRRPGPTELLHGDPLSAIARASRFRTRIVVLRDGWWRDDGGPFLATYGEDHRPVALLQGARGGYTLEDPTTGNRTRVTEAVAEGLDPAALSFYRPFASEALGVLELLRFGMHSCGRDIGMVVAMSVGTAALSLMTPLATGMVFNEVIPGADRTQLLEITAILLGIAVATALLGLVCNLGLVRLDGRMGSSIQAAVWDRLLSLPLAFFRPFTAGDLATRAMGIDSIRQVMASAALAGLLGATMALFNLVLLFHFHVRLATWGVLLIGVAVAATMATAWLQMRYQREITRLQGRIAGTVLQFLTGLSKLRVAGAEVHAFSTWTQAFAEQRQLQFRVRSHGNRLAAFNAGYPLIASLVIFLVAAPLLSGGNGALRTGDFLAFVVAFSTCLAGLLAVSGAIMSTLVTLPLYELAKPILEAEPEVTHATRPPGTLTGRIDLQSVRFRYSEDGPPVLRDLTLRVRSGEFLALVGPSGSGKSTILRLLLGFEYPESGAIYYDGQDLTGLDPHAVRRQIGVVLQNGRLMPGDLFTNIVGSSRATLQQAWAAAEMAGLDTDIRAMPMGMHTVISEGGGTLSGGQRQRLMIARALVQQPRILFLDEATSALDNHTQAIVSASMERLQATRIVVAHRLSTIVHADRICVLERGQLVQEGNYEQLMRQDGPFAELARRQIA